MSIRMKEQMAAGSVLRVREISFLEYPDGFVVPDLEMRKQIVRHIRRYKPDIIVTSDPSNLYIRGMYINHPDHRAAGLATIDAIFPAAGNLFYFPEILEEGLQPHSPSEVWVSLTQEATVTIDVTPFWTMKVNALMQHKSQIGDPEQFKRKMAERRTEDSTDDDPRFVEGFRRLFKR